MLYLTTPLGELIALDPATGAERWRFDPKSRRNADYGDFANRGVSTWLDAKAPPGSPCRRRIFLATIDARLFAVDGATGRACGDFGAQGMIDLRKGLRHAPFEFAAYEVTSPPLVIGDLVVTGSAIADNSRIAPASGEVRAFDVRTGKLAWRWDPIPQDAKDPAHASWENGSAARTGAANVWSVMVADPERGLIFAPTSSPGPDYFGGLRPGDNRYANSIVALKAATGEVAWHFQTVHHDLWDYDNASPPALATIRRGGEDIPAVLQATKTGMLFVLHRDTGEPLFPVEERDVPASDVARERASKTQPFSSIQLSPQGLALKDLGHLDAADRVACEGVIKDLRNEGIFTPPSERGTLARPSNIGGAHWGGLAFDADRQIAVVPVNTIASMVQLMPANFDENEAEAESDRLDLGYEYTHMEGTGYVMRRRFLRAPSGAFCSPPPWGALIGVDLSNGKEILGSSARQLSERQCARLAESRRPDRDGRQARVHRRDRGKGLSRLRRRDRRAPVARRAARRRARDPDHLSRGRQAVRRDLGGRRGSFRRGRLLDRFRTSRLISFRAAIPSCKARSGRRARGGVHRSGEGHAQPVATLLSPDTFAQSKQPHPCISDCRVAGRQLPRN